MRIRALNTDGDWAFGVGQQNYLTDQDAIALAVKTRLASFLNDCFFDAEAGIDWFNLLGSKNEAALIFSVRSVILSTPGINSLTDVSTTLDDMRNLTLSYAATTAYGVPIGGSVSFPVTPFDGISKFVGEVTFTGETQIDVVTSTHISDARDAIWTLYEEANNFAPVVGAVQPLNATTVRITISPAPSGTFRLVGIS